LRQRSEPSRRRRHGSKWSENNEKQHLKLQQISFNANIEPVSANKRLKNQCLSIEPVLVNIEPVSVNREPVSVNIEPVSVNIEPVSVYREPVSVN